ncbi:MAG: hypothetical protein GXO54_01515, partial [Chloroflexi bacterium]|nr:hypothetical protein [Chloroflexota bacterium]
LVRNFILAAGFQPAAGRHASATMAAGRLPFRQPLPAPKDAQPFGLERGLLYNQSNVHDGGRA